MIFEDDFSAIVWALKKSTSTRDKEETGGLGLYLLRKYICQLNGKGIILSGACCLEFDYLCYNEEAENSLIFRANKQLEYGFSGTIITLFIPFVICTSENKMGEVKEEIDLLEIMEARDGMY